MYIDRINESLIDINELKDLEMLKSHFIFSDEFEQLPKNKQEEIYEFCKCHATNEYCLENLKQIRYAVSRIYFGY
jgi:hypothetical protein